MKVSRIPQLEIVLVCIVIFFSGCNAPPAAPVRSATPVQAIPTAAPPAMATATQGTPASQATQPTQTSLPMPAEHRIAIRMTDGVGEFYDRQTGEKFVPRGSNYIRVASQIGYGGDSFTYHSTFNTNLYDPVEVDANLSKMQEQGYNVARVFIQGSCKDYCIADAQAGLSQAYIANLVDFLQKAKSHGIYVIITTDTEPGSPYYIHMLDTTWSPDFGGTNKSFLTGGGFLMAQEFWGDLVTALIEQNAPLDAILAYELRNELFYESNAPPLSYRSGTIKTYDGKTYNMSSPQDRQQMMDENLLLWLDQVRSSILGRDPTALVTTGFFWPQAPHPARIGDPRVIETRPVIWQSSLDFIDLHPYPDTGLSMAQYVDNFGMAGMQQKPIIMGEFGAVRSAYQSEALAARAMQDWQVESCNYGFDGWLYWTYDMPDQVFYNSLSGKGEIDQALAPVNRPDPCQAGTFDFFEHNLASGAHAEASRSLPDQPPSGAVDGTKHSWWGAGDFAPQWILIDLGAPQTVGSIRLAITQSPAGATIHQVWVGMTVDELYLLHTFEGYTVDGQVLELNPANPIENVRYIRVNTRQSPSWVGWQEIEVLAP